MSEWIEAKSMIDAARKYLGTDSVSKLTSAEMYTQKWDCYVYKYREDDLRVPYSEGYYKIK